MHRRTNTTDTLSPDPGLAAGRVPQNLFDSAEHRSRTPRIGNRMAIDLDFDAKVSFNPRHRINHKHVPCFTPPQIRLAYPLQ